jgi:transcriptional regulator with XRE-family HTH domain
MAKTKIDITALQSALDADRSTRNLSWRQLASEMGVSPSLLSRLRNGYRPDADGFVTLVRWLSLPAETFILSEGEDSSVEQPELMTELAPLLRARKDLEPADIEYLEEVIRATVRRVKAHRQAET